MSRYPAAGDFTLLDSEQPPPTRFVRQVIDGHPNISSIDWNQVLFYEPEHVASWIRFLHRHEVFDLIRLVDSFAQLLRNRMRPPRWDVYVDTQVPVALADAFCQLGVISGSRSAFNVSVAYSTSEYYCMTCLCRIFCMLPPS